MRVILSLTALLVLSLSAVSMAAEESDGALKTASIYESLDDAGKETFGRLLAAHSLIKSVEHTQDAVTKAVTSCKKNQPEIKKEIKKSYKLYNGDIKSIMKKANRAFTRTIALEDVLPKKEMRAYFSIIDKEALEIYSTVETIAISDLKACQKLQLQLQDEHETARLKDILNQNFGFTKPLVKD